MVSGTPGQTGGPYSDHRLSPEPQALDNVVDAVCSQTLAYSESSLRNLPYHMVPSRTEMEEIVEALRSVFFPGFYGSEVDEASLRFHVGAALAWVSRRLQRQVRKGLAFSCTEQDPRSCSDCAQRAIEITRRFLEQVPRIQQQLAYDVEAAFDGDPAAVRPDEVIICYPGLVAMTNYRVAHELALLDVPLLPRIIAEHSHSVTGIDIHPGAQIGEHFFIDHGSGVVIGETCIIGNWVRIYQGVTLGAKSFPLDENGKPIKSIPRHPIVEDNVIIYSGATILGRITLGKGAVIGGNVWITEDVPAGGRVAQATPHDVRFNYGAGI